MTLFHNTRLKVLTRAQLLNRVHVGLILLAILVLLTALLKVFFYPAKMDKIFLSINLPSTELATEERISLAHHLRSLKEKSFWEVNVDQLQANLESLNWVYQADLKKHWPDKLELHVWIETPVVLWNEDGFLNAHGEPIYSLKPDLQLPRIHAPEGSTQEAMAHFKEINQKLGEISTLWLSPKGELKFLLAPDTLVNFGAGKFDQKISWTHKIISTMPGEGDAVASIDFRYSRGAALSWHSRVAATLTQH